MTSAAMQLGNAIASIGNIDDIWFNDDLSDGEKTLQILLAIGNAIGGVAQVAGNVKNTMGLLRTAFGKTSVSGGMLAGAMEYMEHQTKQVTEKQGAYIAQQNIYQKESAESAMSQVQELGYVEALAKAYRVLSAAMAENNLIRKDAPTGLIFSQGDLTAIQEDIDMLFDESLSKRIKSAMKKVEQIGQEPTNDKAVKASTVKELAKKGIKDPKFKGNKNQLSFMDALDNAIDKDESKTAKKLLTQDTVKDTTKGLSEVAEAAKKTGEALGNDKNGAAVGAGLKGAIKGVGSLLAKVPGWGWVAAGALAVLTVAVYAGVKA